MKPSHRSIAAAWLLLGLVGACSKESSNAAPPAERSSSTDDPSTEEPTLEALRELRRSLTLEKQSSHVTAMNQGSYETTAQRARTREETADLPARVPNVAEHDDEVFAKQLIASGRAAAVTISDVEVGEASKPTRALPEASPQAWVWTRGDLVVTWPVTFRIDALTALRVLRWWKGLPQELPRLLRITQLTEVPGGWTVVGEIYGFRTPTPPRHTISAPSLDERLAAAGIDPDTITSAQARALLAQCRELSAAIDAELPKVRAAMAPLTRNHLLDARWRLFTNLTDQVEKTDIKALLGR